MLPRRPLVVSGDSSECSDWGEVSCYWHLVARDKARCQTSYNAEDRLPQQRVIQPQMSIVPRLRSPAFAVNVPLKVIITPHSFVPSSIPAQTHTYIALRESPRLKREICKRGFVIYLLEDKTCPTYLSALL